MSNTEEKKSVGIAYMLWCVSIFGMFCLHRIYLARFGVFRAMTMNFLMK